jgi:hypothetical protein
MPTTWLRIRIELRRGGGLEFDPAPGRDMLVGPGHTFAQLAEAIEQAFARWDRSHLHGFELADGRRIGHPDEDFAPDVVWLDHAQLIVAREVQAGDTFEYVFDFGDHWLHRCSVVESGVDPVKAYGDLPDRPVAVWGWGWLPDQYLRHEP